MNSFIEINNKKWTIAITSDHKFCHALGFLRVWFMQKVIFEISMQLYFIFRKKSKKSSTRCTNMVETMLGDKFNYTWNWNEYIVKNHWPAKVVPTLKRDVVCKRFLTWFLSDESNFDHSSYLKHHKKKSFCFPWSKQPLLTCDCISMFICTPAIVAAMNTFKVPFQNSKTLKQKKFYKRLKGMW